MKHNFDSITDRNNSNSVKWDYKPGVIPLWVADMDFKAAPCILQALQRKLDHGVFGYTNVPDTYYQAVIDWFGRRHGWAISKDSIIPISGIVPATSIAIKALTEPGDKVVMHTPAYNCFFSNIRNVGCELVPSPLVRKDGAFTMNFDQIAGYCADPAVKVFLLCNPHNPSGRLWTREELIKLGNICLENGVKVISDEIHCDICPPGSGYVPFASISREFAENSISFCSPTKPFNLAGIEIANIVSANAGFRQKMDRVINIWEHCDVNQFGVVALEAAYSSEGEEWLDQMNSYVHDNFIYMRERLQKEFPELVIAELEATYLSWVDCSGLGLKVSIKEMTESLIANEKVWINPGGMYGDENYVRINLACPRATLAEGLDRVCSGIRRLLSD